MKAGSGLAIAAVLAASVDAAAEEASFRAVSPNALRELFGRNGVALALDLSTGDATLRSRDDGDDYDILFYECDGGRFAGPARPDSACLSFEYRAVAPRDVPGEDAEVANRWNEVYHFGKAWRDELGAVAVQMSVVVDGGVTARNILATHDRWRRTLAAFLAYVETR